jgi:hypothetical protein
MQKDFRVMNIFNKWFRIFKTRNQRRLDKTNDTITFKPSYTARNFHFDVAFRDHATCYGGIAAIHHLVNKLGLAKAIDERLHLLKLHMPYHESDHVLGIAYNALCQGTRLEHIERLRTDEAYLDLLGTKRIPDPTTEGDFCRRFSAEAIACLNSAVDYVRKIVWAKQPVAFFDRATIDVDGTLVATNARCKEGIDIAYDGTWGYHPLIVSLAETGEVLRVINRPGNRPSHEGAFTPLNEAILLCYQAGYLQIRLRGDTDFSQTKYLDIWDLMKAVKFVFGYDACPNLAKIADELPESAWTKLARPAKYQVKTEPRRKPKKVKDRIVKERGYDVLKLNSEEVAEFEYQPTACEKPYRMVVVRKNITKEKGEVRLFDEVRYFFYITNDIAMDAHEIVFDANDRCNQENLHSELKNGVGALRTPTNTLESNWAWMVMASLAWNLKAWWVLMLPEEGRWRDKHKAEKTRVLRMEFRTFVDSFVLIPCKVAKKAGAIVVTILSWNPLRNLLFRLLNVLHR